TQEVTMREWKQLGRTGEQNDTNETRRSKTEHNLHETRGWQNKAGSEQREKACPAGWRTFSGSCYFLSTESGSWTRARQDCRGKGADLVIIDVNSEQTFLSKLTKSETWSWIGLTDGCIEGTWKWIDESSLTLRYWEAKQPDNGGGDPKWGEEDCAHIRSGKNTEENWNDRSCEADLRWICEKMA
uniref:C-type lectin domain-containing protein n=1 Tax=Amphilophus citrinellus TaxID=61819 RepID=A0A3Q0RHA7_AMPCI